MAECKDCIHFSACMRLIVPEHEVLVVCEHYTEEKQAVWIIDPDGYYPYCSNCRHEPEPAHYIRADPRTKYCPNCGYRMRKEYE